MFDMQTVTLVGVVVWAFGTCTGFLAGALMCTASERRKPTPKQQLDYDA